MMPLPSIKTSPGTPSICCVNACGLSELDEAGSSCWLGLMAGRTWKRTSRIVVSFLGVALWLVARQSVSAQLFTPGDLIVSRSVYEGTASTVTVGQALPGGGTAVVNGSYPNVWQNEGPDPSFGVTSPIFLDQITPGGSFVNSLALDPSQIVTSFSSKSELSLSVSTDGKAITFMGYAAPVNALDVSNSGTPNHSDPTNPVGFKTQRAIGQIDASGQLQVTPVNAYSGNNGRAAILANNVNGSGVNTYYTVGNAGNGSGTEPVSIVNNTGVQMTTPGVAGETTVVGKQQGTPGSANGFQFGYSVTQNGFSADKSGKDDNFRGMTIFNNTLYVTKGSGNNGINTVYQVGPAGALPTAATAPATAINVLPGFPTGLAKSAGAQHPFGLWFANANTLYVADEGDGTATDPNAGLQKWTLANNTWTRDYVLQNGLNLGTQYHPSGYTGPAPATGGLRDLTGRVNQDGTVTLYATTSTISANTDQGADPNLLLALTDTLAFTVANQAASEKFATIDSAANGEVLRGVAYLPDSFVPVPEPSTVFSGLGALSLAAGAFSRGKRRTA